MEKESFKEFVLDQLHLLERVECNTMFGGHGLYCEGIFFGIIADGRVYFKTNPNTVSDYLERDMKPFQPNSKQTLKNYYEVPVEIQEDDGRSKARPMALRGSPRCQRSHISDFC